MDFVFKFPVVYTNMDTQITEFLDFIHCLIV
jgi:hypothetical protein